MGKFDRRSLGQAGAILTKSGVARFGSTKGQSTVEFAMVASLFLLLLLAVVDYGWILFAQMNVQQAVDDGGRYASTGQGSGAPGGNTRITSIIAAVQSEISVPGVDASQLQICSVPPGGTTSSCYSSANPDGTGGAAGGPGYTVTLKLTTTLPLLAPLNLLGQFFPSAGYTFTASSTFQNYSFDPSDTD